MARTAVDIRTDDGVCPTSVFRPSSGAGPWPAVIFYMDGPGIRPVLFEMGQRLADHGYLVLLPDLFYRAGPYEPIKVMEVFGDAEKRAAWMGTYFASTDKARAANDTAHFLAFLDTLPDVKGKRIGGTGYCMGGGMVLTAAARFPDRFAAAASFHGGGLATDAADSPHKLAPQIKAKCLIIGADKDQGYSPEAHATLKAAFDAAGADFRAEIWEGALHGWNMRDVAIYNEAAAERHWRELTALFDGVLK